MKTILPLVHSNSKGRPYAPFSPLSTRRTNGDVYRRLNLLENHLLILQSWVWIFYTHVQAFEGVDVHVLAGADSAILGGKEDSPGEKRINVFVKRVIGRSGSKKTVRDVPPALEV